MLKIIKKYCYKFGCKSLKKRAIIAFLFIVAIAILNIVIVQSMLKKSEDIAVIVNASGKMRLLSQQTAMHFFAAHTRDNDASLYYYKQQFEDVYKALKDGGQVLGLSLEPLKPQQQKKLLEVHDAWLNYVDVLNSFDYSRPQSKFEFDKVISKSDLLLSSIESLISDLLLSYKQIHQNISYTSYGLFIFDLLILLLVYRVFITRVIRPIDYLSTQADLVAKGNYSYRTNFSNDDEFARLSRVLNSTAKHIEYLLNDLDKRQKRLNRSNQIFDSLASNSVAGIYILDESLRLIYANEQLANILHCKRSKLTKEFPIKSIFSPDEFERVQARIQERISGRVESAHYETKVIRLDGTYVDIEVFGAVMQVDGAIMLLGLVLDVSERKAAETSLRRAALIYQNSSEGMVVTDKDGYVLDVNQAFENITGYSASEILGNRLNILSSGKHSSQFYKKMWDSIVKTGNWDGDIRNRHKSGEEFVEHLKVNTIYNEDGSVHSRIGLFSDVTEKRRQEASVWHQANYDNLTKLPNRLMFQHALEQEILLAKRENLKFALLFLDLDYFKDVNDTYGHDEGDELLKIMASRLKTSVRKSDLVARLGGDEFTIILKNIKSEQCIDSIAKKVVAAVAQPYKLRSNTVNVSASVGISLFPEDGDNSEILLRNADLAMYAAKEKGRNQYSLYTERLLIQANTRKQLIQDIHLALIENQFELFYQPIINLKSGAITHAEALIRWHHPIKGLIQPKDFIDLAEDTGQITKIGNWVFEKVVNQIIDWRYLLNKEFTIGVNVSPVQFQNSNMDPNQWIQFMAERGLSKNCISLEITERLYLDTENSIESIHKLEAFSNAGVAIVLDDFGTGYSSLSHLNQFKIDYLKIDRSYIDNLTTKYENYVLCQAMIVMAHELGILVVAEGVTTKEQHDLLVQAGCDFGQGFYYSHPLSVPEFNKFIAA